MRIVSETHIGPSVIGARRPSERSWRVSSEASPTAERIISSSVEGFSARRIEALATMTVSRLLKSWATPAASRAIASTF